jgi:DNA-binding transcriptional MerR regulator
MSTESSDDLLTTRILRQRYKITGKTVREWELNGTLPPPERIGRRKYWRRSVLEEAERSGMSRRAKSETDAVT